jgi:hypothetical protein
MRFESVYAMQHRKSIINLLVAVQLFTGASVMTQPTQQKIILLPVIANGWTAVGTDHRYQDRQLYEYIDGAGELYLSYGFKSLVNRKYARPGQPDITLDLFDMGSSRNAFGVFSQSREKIENDAGQGSEYAEGQMIFWKDRYYVSIMSQSETPEVKKAVFELAKKIADSVPDEGALPAILGHLPQNGLVPESVRYFRHHVWLNSHYFISDKNILHISEKTEAVLAKYGSGPKRTVLLLVEYPDEKEVSSAREDFTKNYLPDIAGRRALRIEDGSWTALGQYNLLLAVVFNAPTEKAAMQLIDNIVKDTKK